MSEREIIIVYTYIRLYIRRHQTLNKRRHCLHYLHLRVDEKKNWGNIKKKKTERNEIMAYRRFDSQNHSINT